MLCSYENTANLLVNRIEKLIPKYPEILEIKDVFDLFNISDFECNDLAPSLAQASWALSKAKQNYKDSKQT